MIFQANPYLIWQLTPGIITLALGLYILSRPQKKRESIILSAFMFSGAIWSLANAVQGIIPSYSWQLFWNTFSYIGILIIPTAWFFLVVSFTGYLEERVKKRQSWFWVVPACTFLLILTNNYHHLFFSSLELESHRGFVFLGIEWGSLFYLHTYYSYLLLFLGMIFLLIELITNFKKYGIQAYGLLIGVITPLVGNIIYIFVSLPKGFPDPTPIAFTVTGVAFAWAIVSGRMFETIPLAHDSIVQNLSTGIIVLDSENTVLDINPSAINMLRLHSTAEAGKPLPDFIKKSEETSYQITIPETERIYEVSNSKIKDKFGNITGRLLQLSDISQRKQAETNLAITQQTFNSVLDTLQDGYFEADPNGIITHANRAFVQALGFSRREDVIGSHFRNFTDRKALREIFAKFNELYKTKQPLDAFEYKYRTKDGTTYIGETVVSPIMDGEEIIGTRGIFRDATARVKAEREISEKKDLLDGLLQHAPYAIVINDLERMISVVNPAFERLFGYTQEEVLGKSLDDLLSTPEIVEEMRSFSGVSLETEVHHIGKRCRKDGLLVDVEIISVPFYVSRQKYGNLIFYQDISSRLKAEADLEKTNINYFSILDTLQDAYFEADPNGIMTYVNQAFVKALHYPSREELIGKHFRRFVSRKTIRTFFRSFQKVYETKLPVDPFELIGITLDGIEYTSEMVVSPIIDDGEVIGTRGIVRDISERIKASEILQEAKEAAEIRAGELAAINRVAETVSRSLDLQEVLQSVCQELTGIFEIRNAGIGLLDTEKKNLEIIAFNSIDPEEASAVGLKLPLEGNLSSQEVITTKKTVVIGDAQNDPRTRSAHDLFRSRRTKSIMIIPLLARGRAIGTIGMPAKDPNHRFADNEIELAETIASQIASAVDNAQLHMKTESALGAAESDLEIGSQIQSGFFPDSLPNLPGWEIATYFHSARQVAGDFYDIFQFKKTSHTAFVIADVCDKGVGAALFMVLFRSLLRAFSDLEIDGDNVHDHLLDIILRTNNFIAEIHGQSNMFATIFFGILDPESGVLHYSNGGHEPPIIMNKEGRIIKRLMPTGPAVGMFPDLDFNVGELQLERGDILVGFTDGVTDARNKDGQSFTEDRLIKIIKARWTSTFSMIFELETELKHHIGGQDQYDDITLISFRRKLTSGVDSHSICRVAEFDRLSELRDFVESAAVHSCLKSDDVFAFKLAAEEIITNIIQYGYQDRKAGSITIVFECDAEKATMEIVDDGQYFPPDQAASPDVSSGLEERTQGGLGIYLVKELMDEVSYRREVNNTNHLILEKKLN